LSEEFLRVLKKVTLVFIGLVLACIGLGQVPVWKDPNILVPSSTMPQPAGHRSTHYLVYKGPRNLVPNGGRTADSFHPDQNPAGFWPSQIHTAYKIPSNLGTGAIAVTLAFDNPNALSDFNTFSSQFGLPMETSSNATASTNKHFQVVYANGTQPAADAGWSGESSLDLEWTHAMAPNAKIYLVEGADNSDTGLFGAVAVARTLPGVKEVSMSWGGGEYSGELGLDSSFNNTGVVYFASAGDAGGVQSYPAESPYVVGVGGTHLVLDSNNNIVLETAWSDSGGGPSSVEPRPTYQNIVSSVVGASRGCPDIAAVADPYTGVAVYSGYGFGGWGVLGGTSVSCPMSAGIANARGQWSTGPIPELNRIYNTIFASTTLWHLLYRDITAGTAGSFSALVGWDFITGIGSPQNPYPSQNGVSYSPTNPQVIAGTESPTAYRLISVSQPPLGETAAVSTDFILDHPASAYASLGISAVLTSPFRTTGQVFIYNPSTQKYEVLVSGPGTGSASTLQKDVTALIPTYAFASGGHTIMRFAYRAIAPSRSNVGAFLFNVGAVSLTGTLNGN
jgi:subtilase family serine protease